jgi:hypothetical protein
MKIFTTAQEIFDHVAKALLQQNEKSIISENGGTTCMYRSPDGLKCAAGHIIPDEAYHLKMECHTVEKLGFFQTNYKEHLPLLRALQVTHDNYEPEDWKQYFLFIARCYDLDTHKLSL